MWIGLFERVLREGSLSLDYVFSHPERHFAFSLNPLERDGKVFGISIFGKDISRLKQAEEERQRIELQLWQSQKMESLGSLAGGIAHDFNNMLGGIIGYADLLLSNEVDPKRQNYLKAILGAAERSSEMTRKLLAFGRRGKNVVEPVELDTLVREGHEMLKPSLKQGVDVLLELEPVPCIDADPSQINQVFLNLVINANEAMADRGVITIRTRVERLEGLVAEALGVPAGEYVAFSVSDTGIGMSEEVRSQIFEPFFTTKTDGKVLGSGLGLSTVYGIVQSHHGGIRVESSPDQGSTFTAYFPKGKLGDTEGAAAVAIPKGRGLILVVEDEPVMMKFTQAALRELGYTSISAWDGEEGARVFQERHHEITAVILDLKMPKMGGRECFGELQRIDPGVSVLICTGYGENEEVQELISRGARGLLKKPFRVAELAEHLKRMIPSE
jgi:signal transduction histidine kinase/CheY-like chemotaxis protein